MKMQHKACGGIVTESTAIPPYNSEEYGIIPAHICQSCNAEIQGDIQIELIPENETDKIQIEAMFDY